jgi:hypothetical protein
VAVGHDLSRGVAKFARRKLVATNESVDDPANAGSVGGEAAEGVDPPGRPADLPPDSELFGPFDSDRFDTTPVPPAGYVAEADSPDAEDLEDDDVDDDVSEEIDGELAVAAA